MCISAPRTICYTLPTTQRKFDFQNPSTNKANVELKGNLGKKIQILEAKEETKY
jgi:hypothetical protein